MVLSELLVQSVGDVIHVFPAWPEQRNARFRRLRTQGGFLISSDIMDGRIGPVEIYSTVGGPLRIFSPWQAITVRRSGQTRSRSLALDALGMVEVSTRPGDRLVFEQYQMNVNGQP